MRIWFSESVEETVRSDSVCSGVRGKFVAPGMAEVMPGVAAFWRDARRDSSSRRSRWDVVSSLVFLSVDFNADVDPWLGLWLMLLFRLKPEEFVTILCATTRKRREIISDLNIMVGFLSRWD